jgi:7-cyano-7-deazaguanine synthase
MKNNSALVVFSGGQDSTTCLFWAKQKFTHTEALAFNYGQRHVSELEAATKIADLANVPFRIMELPLLNSLTTNSLTRKDIEIDKQPGASTPNTLVEGRNMLFLTYAAIYAKSKGINNLVTGVSQTDFSGYPDCRDNFIRSINLTLNLAMDYTFVIHTPLMFLTKCETWELAEKLGAFDIVKNQTVTCYQGIAGAGCGECPSCQLRQKGLDEYYKLK